ncbi:MAG: DUF4238 domain-containing protein [Proteobacteria bacterium]|nr:DUF4238 domain-containing protein [Pseudomonadota bacterium]MBU1389728.1 DUF4238 domain-containing protein [Pseudomonadota bacterium]MBU1542666.1 DUF4238 domain-containing protein [Pseudomonadota bacterium]MBU2429241.1 DUF4238 domain-containing protein [Pseudomonadota bacterium]MBU2480721.1 DUF4238 domain-containing protein [Pseudomonadota bacterium]
MKLTTDVKKQHTVPRFLLNNFGAGKNKRKKKLFTFDKHNDRVYQQSVLDATTRNSFYNVENHPERLSLEPILERNEAQTAIAIKKIIKTNSLVGLTKEDRENIAIFIIMQRARTFHALESINLMMDSLVNKARAMGYAPYQVSELLTGEKESEDRKNLFLHQIISQVDLIPVLLKKSWILYQGHKKDPFYISDNPVALHNDIDMGPYGNLGYSVKGIQIHLPISSTLTLALTCPSIAEGAINLRDNFAQFAKIDKTVYFRLPQPSRIYNHAEAYETGIPMKSSSENIRFCNSLQVTFAEQYVFCQSNDFSLVKQMIKDDESYRHGLRMKIG